MLRALRSKIAAWRFNRALIASRKAEADAIRRGDTRTVGRVRKERQELVHAALAGVR